MALRLTACEGKSIEDFVPMHATLYLHVIVWFSCSDAPLVVKIQAARRYVYIRHFLASGTNTVGQKENIWFSRECVGEGVDIRK